MKLQRFLLCAGIDGCPRALERLVRTVEERRPDGLLFAGGILRPGHKCAVKRTPWGLTRDDGLFVEKFLSTLGRLGVFSAVIPGPMAAPMEEFLRIGMHAELDFPTLHMAHAVLVERADVAVSGIGGNVEDEPLFGVETYSRITAEYFLRSLVKARQPRKILLLPAPPPGPLDGHGGEHHLVGELIDSLHPTLCVVSGQTNRRGVQWIAGTLVVNPGRLGDGSFAWLDWGRPGGDPVEFLSLSRTNPAAMGMELGTGD